MGKYRDRAHLISFIFVMILITVLAGLVAYFLLRDAASGTDSKLVTLIGNYQADLSYRLTSELIAHYFAIVCALAVGFAGAWVAIKIASNTHTLQESVKNSENRKLYFDKVESSFKVYKSLTRSLIELTISASRMEREFAGFISNEHRIEKLDSVLLDSKRKPPVDIARNKLIDRALTLARESKSFDEAYKEYYEKLISLITCTTEISDNLIYSKQWESNQSKQAAFESSTGLLRSLSQYHRSTRKETVLQNLSHVARIKILMEIDFYDSNIDEEDYYNPSVNIKNIESTVGLGALPKRSDAEKTPLCCLVTDSCKQMPEYSFPIPHENEELTSFILAGLIMGGIDSPNPDSKDAFEYKIYPGVDFILRFFSGIPDHSVISDEIHSFLTEKLGYDIENIFNDVSSSKKHHKEDDESSKKHIKDEDFSPKKHLEKPLEFDQFLVGLNKLSGKEKESYIKKYFRSQHPYNNGSCPY